MTMIHYQPWAFRRALLSKSDNAEFDTGSEPAGVSTGWSPAVDIEEYADRFELTADVPGVDPASIEVTLEKGVLVLTGSREKAAVASGVERRRSERASGRFQRRFSLPDTVDSESVTAKTSHGVLAVVIPKRAVVQPRRIPVSH